MLPIFKINFKEINIFSKKPNLRLNFTKLPALKTDTVELSSDNFPQKKALKALGKFHFFAEIRKNTFEISDIKPIKISQKLQNKQELPIEAFIATVKRTAKISNSETKNKTGLFVFSKNGTILGNIETLDTKEWEKEPLVIGKYLRLHYLNASYFDNYKGIGSALIQEATQKSKEYGLQGQLHVVAHNYADKTRGNPLPFYVKTGFIDIENPQLSKEELINKYKHASRYAGTHLYLLNDENKAKL